MARKTYHKEWQEAATAKVHLREGAVHRIVFHDTPPRIYDQIRAPEDRGERGTRWKQVAGITFFAEDDPEA